jgi:hypothetical protein
MMGLQVELPVGDNPRPNNASTHCKKFAIAGRRRNFFYPRYEVFGRQQLT